MRYRKVEKRSHRVYIIAVVGAIAILASLAYLVKPVGHVPPFDANRWRLAETQLEGFCAGEVVVKTNSQQKSPTMAAECREARKGEMSSDVNLEDAIIGFCTAIGEGFGMTMEDCRTAVADNEIWPLYDGGFTMAWNETFRYPGSEVLTNPPSNGRVGDREPIVREEVKR